MALGEIVATVAAVAAIVKAVEEIIDSTDNILKDVQSILKTLRESSSGSFADALQDLGVRLQKVFENLIASLRSIFRFIADAMDKNEKADLEGAAILKALII